MIGLHAHKNIRVLLSHCKDTVLSFKVFQKCFTIRYKQTNGTYSMVHTVATHGVPQQSRLNITFAVHKMRWFTISILGIYGSMSCFLPRRESTNTLFNATRVANKSVCKEFDAKFINRPKNFAGEHYMRTYSAS